MTVRDILQAALTLPEDDRVRLIEELEASLRVDDEAFVALINERVAAVEAGEPGRPAAEVIARLRAR